MKKASQPRGAIKYCKGTFALRTQRLSNLSLSDSFTLRSTPLPTHTQQHESLLAQGERVA